MTKSIPTPPEQTVSVKLIGLYTQQELKEMFPTKGNNLTPTSLIQQNRFIRHVVDDTCALYEYIEPHYEPAEFYMRRNSKGLFLVGKDSKTIADEISEESAILLITDLIKKK